MNAAGARDDGVVGVGERFEGPCSSNASKTCAVVRWPAHSKYATATYEGDVLNENGTAFWSDYSLNDTIVHYSVREYGDENGNLTRIELELVPAAYKSDQSGYLLLTVNGFINDHPAPAQTALTRPLFEGDGSVAVRRYDGAGHFLQEDTYAKNQDAVVFKSIANMFEHYPASPPCGDGVLSCVSFVNTGHWPLDWGNYYAPAQKARVIIKVADPTKNPMSARNLVDVGRYRLVVYRFSGEVEDLQEVIEGIGHPFVVSSQYGFVIPNADFRWLQSSANAYPNPNAHGDFRCRSPGYDCAAYQVYPRLKTYYEWLTSRRTKAISDADLKWYEHAIDEKYVVTFQPGKASYESFDSP